MNSPPPPIKLKIVLGKLFFGEELAWTESLTGEIKRFQIQVLFTGKHHCYFKFSTECLQTVETWTQEPAVCYVKPSSESLYS